MTLYRSYLRPTGAEYVSLAALELPSDARRLTKVIAEQAMER